MKKYFICFFLMMKRMLKRPSFLVLLFMIPLLAIGMKRLEYGEQSETVIGVVTNEDSLWEALQKQDGILEFRKYYDETMLIQAVETEEADCGFVLPENFMEKVMENDWQKTVTLYESSTSMMAEFAKEQIAAAVFTLYAEESYVNYVGQTEAFAMAEEQRTDRGQIVAFAKEAYQSHLVDGSTFSFQYQDEIAEEEIAAEEITVEEIVTEEAEKASESLSECFPVKGVMAVFIFLSGMCGLLVDFGDRQEKRFVRLLPEWMTTAVNVWIPTIYTSFMALVALGMIGKLEGTCKEIGSLLVYQFLLIIYCSIIRVVLRRQERIAAVIPILTLASVICCPVFIRLATYLPVFRVVEKLFPVTYYLMM